MRYTYAEDVRKLAYLINLRLGLGVDLDKVAFIRSHGSKSRALARTLGLPSQWRFILGDSVLYVIEVLSENYDGLPCRDKVYVVVHELMHIPPSMSGGLRHHGYSGFRNVSKMTKLIASEEIKNYCS